MAQIQLSDPRGGGVVAADLVIVVDRYDFIVIHPRSMP